jgi:hypothetical protein
MSKKLMTGLLALVALAAMALPAVASASPEIGETSGGVFTKLATGVSIRGTNVGETLMTDASGNVLVRCTTAQMDGTLNTNSGTLIEGTINSATFTGTGSGGACTGFFGSNATITTNVGNGTPWCLSAGGKLPPDTFSLRGDSCANTPGRSITFVLDTSFGQCKYERSSAVTGTFVTDVKEEQATATATKQEFPAEAGNPFGCPGAGYLDMTFKLETTTGVPLYIR